VAAICWGNSTNRWHLGITRLAKPQRVNPPECPAIYRKSKTCRKASQLSNPNQLLGKDQNRLLRGELHHERELSQLLVGG